MPRSAQPYAINNTKIPILLDIVQIRDLRPHEETIPDHLEKIVDLLRKEPVLHHPIIADKNTGLVLDGTHRLGAMKKLHCNLAPCAIVDYQNPQIQIDRWYRAIEATTLEGFRTLASTTHSAYVNPQRAENCLSRRTCYATVGNGRSSLIFPTTLKDPVTLTKASFQLEQVARSAKLQLKYVDHEDLRPAKGVILSTIRLEKQEVLEAATRGKLFPPKTTRHLIPSRPLGLGVSLSWLRGHGVRQERSRFINLLQSGKFTRKPPGSRFGSRIYREEILVYG